jgi:hypothetical protein
MVLCSWLERLTFSIFAESESHLIKKSVRNLRRPILPLLWKFVQDDLYSRIKDLPDFPNSACQSTEAIELTIQGASQSLNELFLISLKKSKIHDSRNFVLCKAGQEFRREFASVFTANGSDKSTTHTYETFYAKIICNLDFQVNNLFEIGIGSNNTKVPSNMGSKGVPGASIRSWSKLLPLAQIVAADIDKDTLIFSSKVKSFYLDQTDDESWLELKTEIPGLKFDLIIDDGLHSPIANFKTIKHCVEFLSSRGVLIIEDIPERSISYWLILKELGMSGYTCDLVQAGKSYIFYISKNSNFFDYF